MRIQGIIVLVLGISVIVAAQTTDSTSRSSDDSLSITTTNVPAAGSISTQSTDTASDNTEVLSSPDTADTVLSVSDTVSSTADTPDSAEKTLAAPDQGPIIEETEEDLILDGGEESILAPIATEPPVQPVSVTSDSAATPQTSGTSDSAVVKTDVPPNEQKKVITHYPAEAMPKIEDTPKPVLIEKTQSINFAKNFKEYRSPKVAILLSLLVPGTGQAYAHHKLKAGIFGAVEVAFIAAGAIVGYQGNKRTKEAHSFADTHYSMDSISDYHSLLTGFESEIDFDSVVFYGEYDQFERDASKKNQSYYDNINRADGPYVQGWDDVIPHPESDFSEAFTTDSGTYVFSQDPDSIYLAYFIDKQGDTIDVQFGFSDNQKNYSKQLSKANSFFRWSKSLFSMLLINHIVSAVDAGITAKAYNDKLLGKTSLWQNINLKEKVVSTPVGPAQGYSLEVRF